MAAPQDTDPVNDESQSSSGYEDGLGRRVLAFDRETGGMLERLILRPELNAFEQALKERIAIVSGLEDEHLARPRGLEKDSDDHLIVVSEFLGGRRLTDIIDSAAEHGIVAGIDAALGVLLELLPALSRMHDAGLIHGVLAPGRVMITSGGQVVLLDTIYGEPLERLQLTRKRLWSEFRLAFPPTAGLARFDKAADIGHAAMIAATLTVGRALQDNDYPEGIAILRKEIQEIASIRGSKNFAEAVDKFLGSTLPLSGRRTALTSADEAAIDLRKLVRKELGINTCRTALLEFLQQVEAADAERIAAMTAERERLASVDTERRTREDAERKTREDADRKARAEAERAAKEQAERKARDEADRTAKEQAEQKAREEAERSAKEQAERKAREEAERKAREVAERKAREEAERKAKEEAEHKARAEAERKAREEAERKAREEAERSAKEQAERKTREEAERKAREEAERKAREEAERKAREEAERKAREEAERKAREEAERKAREEAERKAREEAERKAREEAERKAREEAERKAREEAERKAREEAERKAREEAERKAREEAERRAREEAERKAREEAERKAREEAERKAREEAERKAREEAERKAREEAERKAREDAERKERERLERERIEAERLAEDARLRAEQLERDRREAERQADEARREAERLERDRAEAAQRERDQRDRDRLETERAEQERAEREEREREEREEQERAARGPLVAPNAQSGGGGWLIPPGRSSSFDPTVPDEPPAPPPASIPLSSAKPYPIYVPPAEPASWNADMPAPEAHGSEIIAPIAAAAPPSPPAASIPLAAAAPAAIGIKLQGAEEESSPARSDSRREPIEEEMSAADAYGYTPPKERQPIPWKLLAAGVVLIAATYAISNGYTPAAAPVVDTVRRVIPARTPANPATAPIVGNVGRLNITTQPPGAKVTMDGKAAGETPLTIDGVKPGRHVLVLTGPEGTANRTVRVAAGQTLALDVPLYSGFVTVSIPFVVNVAEGGKTLGTSENQIILSPGRHDLRLTNKELNYSATETVEIQSGETTRLNLDPRGRANINAVPWAEVWIDGESVGQTPLANVAIRLGVREIVFKNPQYPDQKRTVTIVGGAPASISVDFIK